MWSVSKVVTLNGFRGKSKIAPTLEGPPGGELRCRSETETEPAPIHSERAEGSGVANPHLLEPAHGEELLRLDFGGGPSHLQALPIRLLLLGSCKETTMTITKYAISQK